MQTVVGVRFKKAGKIYFFDPVGIELAQEEYVIVETARGVEIGQISVGPKQISDESVILPLKPVLRKATEKDLARATENETKEPEALRVCEEKIIAHKLPMSLVGVEFTFDAGKIIFYFTAEGRVDFRDLVKDLAGIFRTRIELRQIGVRDEAKMMGGIGCCGRELCCSTFLGDFAPVSIRMAKEQNLSLNPTKISGICGRLMCCLKYESDSYSAATCRRQSAPKVGVSVVSTEGEAKITAVDMGHKTATVETVEGQVSQLPWNEMVEKDKNA